MKPYIVLFSGLLTVMFAHAQDFTLNGKITGIATGKMKLYHTDKDGKRAVDSTMLKNGNFVFKGTVDAPSMAYLAYGDGRNEANSVNFFIEPTAMTITMKLNDFSHAVITGSKTQEEYVQLEKLKEPIRKEMEPLSKAYAKAGNALRAAEKAKKSEQELDSLKYNAAAIHDQFEPYFNRQAQIDYAFFAQHPQSYVTAFNLRFHTTSLTLDSLQMFYDHLGPVVQQSESGKDIAKEIAQLRAGSPGSVAKDFTATDINGKSLSLSDFKGKYVLIDFWASWCVPCRKSMPHVKELYEKYGNKGFDVIAISDDDRDTTAWKKAVAKDGTGIWHNVLRGLDWDKIQNNLPNDKDISDKFGIHSLPTKILIDKNGTIIGRYDKGTEEEALALDKKLSEVFNN